jgi:hypothetical protein
VKWSLGWEDVRNSEVGMRNEENKKRRRAKGKGIGWKVEGVRLKA